MKLECSNVWKGRSCALAALNGTYQENFQLLWNFKAELMTANPGSVCEIDIKTVRKKGGIVHYFNRLLLHSSHALLVFWKAADRIWASIQPFLQGSTQDSWLQLLVLMDIAGCFLWLLGSSRKRTQKIGCGSCSNLSCVLVIQKGSLSIQMHAKGWRMP